MRDRNASNTAASSKGHPILGEARNMGFTAQAAGSSIGWRVSEAAILTADRCLGRERERRARDPRGRKYPRAIPW